MRTAVLVFFYGCLCAGAFRTFMGWARRTCARHVDAAIGPDPRVLAGLELAKGNPDFAQWEAELNDRFQWPYDQEVQGS